MAFRAARELVQETAQGSPCFLGTAAVYCIQWHLLSQDRGSAIAVTETALLYCFSMVGKLQ